MATRLRKTLIVIVLVVVSSVVTLLAFEVAVRLLEPQTYFAATVNTWDRERGTKHMPGAKGFLRCREFAVDLIINSKGLRDREYPYEKAEGVRRILCLGGSITCGYGVHAHEAWPKILEDLLNENAPEGETWEVLNGGVGSTGTAHQLAFFQTEGYKYEPDFVMLSFCQVTDFWDNVICCLYTLEDGALVKHDAPKTGERTIQNLTRRIPGYNTIFGRSHLLSFIKYRVARRHFGRLVEQSDQPVDADAAENRQQVLTRKLLAALNRACAGRECRLVMTIPPLADCATTQYGPPDLLEFARDEGIPYVDLASVFSEAKLAGAQNFYPIDGHWNKDGHRLAGQVLYEFFAREFARTGESR